MRNYADAPTQISLFDMVVPLFIASAEIVEQRKASILFLEIVGKKIYQWLDAEKTMLYNDTLDNTPANVKAMGKVPLRIYHPRHIDVFTKGVWLED